jgi:hypothetical protein
MPTLPNRDNHHRTDLGRNGGRDGESEFDVLFAMAIANTAMLWLKKGDWSKK